MMKFKTVFICLFLTLFVNAENITIEGDSMMPFMHSNSSYYLDASWSFDKIVVGDVVRYCFSEQLQTNFEDDKILCVAHAVIWRNLTHFKTKGTYEDFEDKFEYKNGSVYVLSFEENYDGKFILSDEVQKSITDNIIEYLEEREKMKFFIEFRDAVYNFLREVGLWFVSLFR